MEWNINNKILIDQHGGESARRERERERERGREGKRERGRERKDCKYKHMSDLCLLG
jgi:hypothetical protein